MFTHTHTTAPTAPVLPPVRRRRGLRLAAVGVTGLLALSACSTDETTQDTTENTADSTGSESTTGTGSSVAFATASVANADGEEVGTAEISEADGSSELSVDVSGLVPGMYGMHLHAVGACEPDSTAPNAGTDDSDDPETGDFLSAGGHLGAEGHDHPDHGGDLPALLVNEDGSGSLTVTTDRIEESELLDDDGSAIIIHEDADNYGNVPERYAPDGPDEDTLSTGDAGGRQACGVFEAA